MHDAASAGQPQRLEGGDVGKRAKPALLGSVDSNTSAPGRSRVAQRSIKA